MRTVPALLLVTAIAVSALVAFKVCGAAPGESGQALKDLMSPDADTRTRAKIELLRPENLAHVGASRDVILRAIPAVESEQDALLLGRLVLPEDRKQAVLASPHTPVEVRARLGDADAMASVIARFEQAASIPGLRKAAQDLLYVGDAEAIQAFSRRFDSRDVFTDPHGNRASVVLLMIQAYGLAHPDATLFRSTTYLEYANASEDGFQASGPQDYLRAIEAFWQEQYQIAVHLNPPVLLDTNHAGVRKAPVGGS